MFEGEITIVLFFRLVYRHTGENIKLPETSPSLEKNENWRSHQLASGEVNEMHLYFTKACKWTQIVNQIKKFTISVLGMLSQLITIWLMMPQKIPIYTDWK